MKILYLSNALFPSKTAHSNQIMKMCQSLTRRGNSVTLFGIRNRNILNEEIFQFYGISNKFNLFLDKFVKFRGDKMLHGLFLALKIIINKYNKDSVIYSRSIFASFWLSFLTKSFYECHSIEQKRHNYLTLKKVLKSKNILGIICISENLKNDLVYHFNLKKNKIIVLPDAGELYKVNNFNSLNGFHVGYAGSIGPSRGIELIIYLANVNPEVMFHVFGGTDDEVSRWKNIKLPENLNFYGFIAPGQIQEQMSKMNVLLMPYQNYNKPIIGKSKINTTKWMSPLKMFEYMSVGRAIIASDFPVLREVLNDGYNSILCNPDNFIEWDMNLKRLINNPILSKKLGRNAKSDLVKKHTWDKRADKINDLLEKQLRDYSQN